MYNSHGTHIHQQIGHAHILAFAFEDFYQPTIFNPKGKDPCDSLKRGTSRDQGAQYLPKRLKTKKLTLVA